MAGFRRPFQFREPAITPRGDPLLQLLLRRGADLARGELAVLEQHQRRDRHDAVLRRGARVLVDVELDDLDLVAHRAGDLLERRRDHAARAAPLGPEVDHDRAGRLEHLGLESRVGNLANGHGNLVRIGDHEQCGREPMNEPAERQGRHAEVRMPSAASSSAAGISIKSGVSVQTSAARTGRPG